MNKLNIGRIPISKGEFTVGNTYEKLWQVTYLGSTYQSKIDNNTSAPAEKNNGVVRHINTDKWLCIADATKAVNYEANLNTEIERATNAENAIIESVSDVVHAAVVETIDYDGSVDGQPISQLRQELNTEKARALSAEQTNTNNITGHINNNNNPHGVTKVQIGLGNVDNTSDENKPLSAVAREALKTKAEKATTLAGYGITDGINTSEKGAKNGIATLDSAGKIPSAQLPSYVDDVVEYGSKDAFPASGESGKIYIDLSTNLTYRWSGTVYTEISPSLTLGETTTTAYSGAKGKANADAISKILAGTTIVPSATNASTVNSHTVETSVPANAVFTDTTDLASMTDDETHRLVTDEEKNSWTKKWDYDEDAIKAIKVANSEDSDTVGGHTVKKDVPADAVLDGYTKKEVDDKFSDLKEKVSYYSTIETID